MPNPHPKIYSINGTRTTYNDTHSADQQLFPPPSTHRYICALYKKIGKSCRMRHALCWAEDNVDIANPMIKVRTLCLIEAALTHVIPFYDFLCFDYCTCRIIFVSSEYTRLIIKRPAQEAQEITRNKNKMGRNFVKPQCSGSFPLPPYFSMINKSWFIDWNCCGSRRGVQWMFVSSFC